MPSRLRLATKNVQARSREPVRSQPQPASEIANRRVRLRPSGFRLNAAAAKSKPYLFGKRFACWSRSGLHEYFRGRTNIPGDLSQ